MNYLNYLIWYTYTVHQIVPKVQAHNINKCTYTNTCTHTHTPTHAHTPYNNTYIPLPGDDCSILTIAECAGGRCLAPDSVSLDQLVQCWQWNCQLVTLTRMSSPVLLDHCELSCANKTQTLYERFSSILCTSCTKQSKCTCPK